MFGNGQTVIFDSNFEFSQLMPSYVAIEDNASSYDLTYTILSDALEFASASGTIQVSTTQRYHYFNCAQKATSVYSFGVNDETFTDYSQYVQVAQDNDPYIKSGYVVVNLSYGVANSLGLPNYVVQLCVYDSNNVLTTLTETNYDLKSSSARTYFDLSTILEDGQAFSLQIKSVQEDKTYYSEIVTFDSYSSDGVYYLSITYLD